LSLSAAVLFRRQQFHDPEEGVDPEAAAGDISAATPAKPFKPSTPAMPLNGFTKFDPLAWLDQQNATRTGSSPQSQSSLAGLAALAGVDFENAYPWESATAQKSQS
jgi:hypothetical protein